MTVLVAGGDSFTYGTELADCTPTQASELTWSAFLAHKLEMKYMCVAGPGWSNDAIARNVITTVHRLLELDITPVVAIMWSFPNRYEFLFEYDTLGKTTPWESITPWTHERDQSVILDAFKNFVERNFDDYKKHQLQAQSTGLANFSELFYKNVGNNETYAAYNSYSNIVQVQNWLQKNNIQYVFTYVDNVIFKPKLRDDDLNCRVLYSSIDHDYFYHFQGFYNWASDNRHSFYSTHPGEGAHTDFVNKIFFEFVRSKIK